MYCPPNTGPAQYRGEASQELIQILKGIPDEVWPLWTGMKTLVDYKLSPKHIDDWTIATGRKPFFWLNRTSIGADLALARAVDGDPDKMTLPGGSSHGLQPYHLDGDTNKLILPGERLPKELGRYFQGIHLNYPFGVQKRHEKRKDNQFPIPKNISSKELIYFATVSDYIWNPHAWTAEESYSRAVKFVDIINPLMAGE